MYRTQHYPHRYPHCWRCGTELIFRLVDEWFISMDELRDADRRRHEADPLDPGLRPGARARLAEEHGRLDDLARSATTAWRCRSTTARRAARSRSSAARRSCRSARSRAGRSSRATRRTSRGSTRSRSRCAKCGAPVSRIPDVGNPWLDAGIVPFSTLNYRHDRDVLGAVVPGRLHHRGVPRPVPQLVLLAADDVARCSRTAPPFQTRARPRDGARRARRGDAQEQGQRDLVRRRRRQDGRRRHALAVLPPEPGEQRQLRLRPGRRGAPRDVPHALEHLRLLRHLRHARRLDAAPARTAPMRSYTELDRWVLSELHQLVADVTDALAGLRRAAAPRSCVEAFVDDLSNWYVRRSRRRFWKSESDADKLAAYATLYECARDADEAARAVHAVPRRGDVPEPRSRSFDADARRRACTSPTGRVADASKIDRALSDETRLVMRVASLGRAARAKAQLRCGSRSPSCSSSCRRRWRSTRSNAWRRSCSKS